MSADRCHGAAPAGGFPLVPVVPCVATGWRVHVTASASEMWTQAAVLALAQRQVASTRKCSWQKTRGMRAATWSTRLWKVAISQRAGPGSSVKPNGVVQPIVLIASTHTRC